MQEVEQHSLDLANHQQWFTKYREYEAFHGVKGAAILRSHLDANQLFPVAPACIVHEWAFRMVAASIPFADIIYMQQALARSGTFTDAQYQFRQIYIADSSHVYKGQIEFLKGAAGSIVDTAPDNIIVRSAVKRNIRNAFGADNPKLDLLFDSGKSFADELFAFPRLIDLHHCFEKVYGERLWPVDDPPVFENHIAVLAYIDELLSDPQIRLQYLAFLTPIRAQIWKLRAKILDRARSRMIAPNERGGMQLKFFVKTEGRPRNVTAQVKAYFSERAASDLEIHKALCLSREDVFAGWGE